jgi:hypothetical protein
MRQDDFARSIRVIIAVVFISLPVLSIDVAAAANEGATRHFALRIENGLIFDGTKTIEVQRGDVVDIAWSSDVETKLHLHGYDIDVIVGPGRPQTMQFLARATGRFPVHDARHKLLLYVEVKPK